jgi:hypothetical protein
VPLVSVAPLGVLSWLVIPASSTWDVRGWKCYEDDVYEKVLFECGCARRALLSAALEGLGWW